MAMQFAFKDLSNFTKAEEEPQKPAVVEEQKPKKEVRKEWFSHFTPNTFQQLSEESVFALKYSPDGSMLASSLQDGQIQILSTTFSNTVLYQFYSDPEAKAARRTTFPVTGLAWRSVYNAFGDAPQHLIGSMCDGSVMRWNQEFNNTAERLILNPKNQYQCVDYCGYGNRFAVAGMLPQIEVYDDETLKPIQFVGSGAMARTHTNKIFTVKFNPVYSNLCYSGSWDSTVKFWDIRTNQITAEISQTQTCGDSVDMDSDLRTVVTGGGTAGEGIQIWDVRDLSKPVTKIDWSKSAVGEAINRSYNAVKFVPGLNLVVAGCSDDITAKCFNYKTGGNVMQDFHKLKRSCFAIDVSKDASQIALGDYCGNLEIDNIVKAHI